MATQPPPTDAADAGPAMPAATPLSGDGGDAAPTGAATGSTLATGATLAAGPSASETDSARLRLYQLVSPALPVGGFSYAEGLEVLVQSGRLGEAAAVHGWLEAELERGALRVEAAALPSLQALLRHWQQLARQGNRGAEEARRRVLDRDGWLLAQREAPEMRAQLRQMGGSLLQLLADLGWPLPERLSLAWPTAFAWAGHCLTIPTGALVEAYLYSWVANQLSAAVRLVPLGPTEAQRLQLRLGPLIACQASLLAASDPEALWNGGPGAGLAQLGHSELYSRLFRS